MNFNILILRPQRRTRTSWCDCLDREQLESHSTAWETRSP